MGKDMPYKQQANENSKGYTNVRQNRLTHKNLLTDKRRAFYNDKGLINEEDIT